MVDTRMLRSLAPHYVAMLVLIVIAVAALRAVLGEVVLLAEFGVALAIVVAYPFALRRLGIEPGAWD